MHLRPKPWTKTELAACPFYLEDPFQYRNHWQQQYPKVQPLQIELGCGKGSFIAQKAFLHPEQNWLGIDMIDTVLGYAQRNIRRVYKETAINNVRLTPWDISRIDTILSPDDRAENIYINFCNPWPIHKHHKKRLTHPRQLENYKKFLRIDGCIHFKTDDDDLFEDSLRYFESCGFKPVFISKDLHASPWSENIETEHEKMFSLQGIPIKAGIFQLR